MLNLNRLHAALLLTAVGFATGCDGCDDDPSAQGGGGSPPVPVGGQGGFPSLGGFGGEGGGTGGEGGMYVCPSPTTGVALALTELSFGEGNNGQWKSIGFDIDGLVSDASSTDVCQVSSGGNPDVPYPDGNNGIDNSFGKNLVPLILGLVPDWPTTVNTYIDQGLFNTMVKVYCLPPTGDASDLTMKVFNGTNLGSTPAYDGTDEWPVAPEILSDLTDPESSTLVFDNASVADQLFDSGDPSTIVLTIPIEFQKGTTFLKLTLYHARITMTFSDDRKSATGGIIGGVLNTEEVVDQLDKIAFAADLCGQAQYTAAVNFVRQSSDIMSDGTQDPSSTCDGISFGLAFTMSEIQIGPVGEASVPALSCN